jgi:hypothetical protein
MTDVDKPVDKPWDTLMKLLMEKGAQALASIALPGVQVGNALDKELRVTNIEGDLFLDAYLHHLQITVHFEFQKKKGTTVTKDGKEKTMNRRMWEYNCAMDIRLGRPVYSVLVYLTPENDLASSPYMQQIPGTGMGHYFSFLVIKLWEVEKEVLKRSGFEVLLPLLPLTKGSNTPQAVEEMVSELAARDRSDLLELGLFCASLVLKDEIDQGWLRERFHNMLDIIEDSWLYQEVTAKTLQEGIQQGIQTGIQNSILDIVSDSFSPQVVEQVQHVITASQDEEQLRKFLRRVVRLSDEQEVLDLLAECFPVS